jgi:hypothetical protein
MAENEVVTLITSKAKKDEEVVFDSVELVYVNSGVHIIDCDSFGQSEVFPEFMVFFKSDSDIPNAFVAVNQIRSFRFKLNGSYL